MKNQIEFTFDNIQPEGLDHTSEYWDESKGGVVTMEETSGSKRELEQLFLEAQEYSFLMGEIPQVPPDYWVETD